MIEVRSDVGRIKRAGEDGLNRGRTGVEDLSLESGVAEFLFEVALVDSDQGAACATFAK